MNPGISGGMELRSCRRRRFPQFSGLPPEVQFVVMEHLSFSDLLSLRQTSKAILSLSHNCQLWKEKCYLSWPPTLPEDQRHLIEMFVRQVMSFVVSSRDSNYYWDWDPPWHREPSWAFLWSCCGRKPYWALLCLPFVKTIHQERGTRGALDFITTLYGTIRSDSGLFSNISLHSWNEWDEMRAYCKKTSRYLDVFPNIASSSLVEPTPPYIMWTLNYQSLTLQSTAAMDTTIDGFIRVLWYYLPRDRWACFWFLKIDRIPILNMFIFDGKKMGYHFKVFDEDARFGDDDPIPALKKQKNLGSSTHVFGVGNPDYEVKVDKDPISSRKKKRKLGPLSYWPYHYYPLFGR